MPEETKITRITQEQSRRVNRLVRKLCCNCIDDNCLLLDDGDTHKCVQLISISGIYCNYFKRAVLPADKELEAEIYGNGKKKCKQCSGMFTPTARTQRYCKDCAAKRKRQKAAERQRRKRAMKSRF